MSLFYAKVALQTTVLDFSTGGGLVLNTNEDSCKSLLYREPVTSTEPLPYGVERTSAFRLRLEDATGPYLAPEYAKDMDSSESQASTLYTIALNTDKDNAIIFSTETYDSNQGLPKDVLMMYINDKDVHAKALCSGGFAPHRVYEHPDMCHRGGWGSDTCIADWLSCNTRTGYCDDASVVSLDKNAPVSPPDLTAPGSTELVFPNCVTRAVFQLVPASSDAHSNCVTVDPSYAKEVADPNLEKAREMGILYTWIEIAIGVIFLVAIIVLGVWISRHAREKAQHAAHLNSLDTQLKSLLGG